MHRSRTEQLEMLSLLGSCLLLVGLLPAASAGVNVADMASSLGGGPGLASWSDSATVPRLDFKKKSTKQLLKERGPGSPPIVLVNALKGLEQLMRFGKTKTIKSALAGDGGPGNKPIMPSGVKVGQSAAFSYWDNSMVWRGHAGSEMKDIPGQREWHSWYYENGMPTKKFFKHFDKENSSAPYLYWLSSLPEEAVGFDTRPVLCKKFSPAQMLDDCLRKDRAAEPDAVGAVWANTGGLLTHGHFDRENGIFLQLKGIKRWTFWQPQDLGSLCFYPYNHPANRQIQADLGEGVGTPCPKMAGVHNRSIDLGPGEILLVPPLYVHKVETVSPSLSYTVSYPDPTTDQHDQVTDALVKHITSLIINRKNALRTAPVGAEYKLKGPLVGKSAAAVKKRAVASAALRYGLRLALVSTLGSMDKVKSFLTLHWADFDALPERKLLGDSSEPSEHATAVASMCEAETAIAAKLRAKLDKSAPKLAKAVLGIGGKEWPENLKPGLVTEELKYVVGSVIAVAQGSTRINAQMDPKTMQPTVEDRIELLSFGQTKAWFDALSEGCEDGSASRDGKEGGDVKLEL